MPWKDVIKKIDKFIPKGVEWKREVIDRIDKDQDQVLLQNGDILQYDLLIVATGTDIAPDEIEIYPPTERVDFGVNIYKERRIFMGDRELETKRDWL